MLAIYGYGTNIASAASPPATTVTRRTICATIDGAMRHGTTMDVEGNYTDTHGQSWVAFGITRLLGFLLLPRIKGLNRTKLYQAERGDRALYPWRGTPRTPRRA